MPAERYYTPENLSSGQKLYLEGDEFHHLVRVMRASEADQIELVNGRGILAKARIDQIEKRRSLICVEEVQEEQKNPRELILAQAIPRINRLDFILEKGTELGMTKLWLFHAQNSERKQLTEHQLERFKSITIAAMKQCGRLFLPEIAIKPGLAKWDKMPLQAFFGDTNPKAACFNTAAQGIDFKKGVIFFIGPESGFTTDEEALLMRLEVRGVKLHDNILRTDTAALVALSLLSQYQ